MADAAWLEGTDFSHIETSIGTRSEEKPADNSEVSKNAEFKE